MCNTYASPEANAANDSLLLRPNNVCGTRDIVTTECRRPDEVDAYRTHIHEQTWKNETSTQQHPGLKDVCNSRNVLYSRADIIYLR